jgi:hypothetical protein
VGGWKERKGFGAGGCEARIFSVGMVVC